jgi:hypothetical protein
MLRCLVLLSPWLLTATAAAESSATADRCTAPPYGDTSSAYRFLVKELSSPQRWQDMALICQMKSHEISRKPLHDIGFTDEDIDQTSATVLLIEEIGARQALERAAKTEPQFKTASSTAASPVDSSTVSVRQFVLDGQKLARAGARVRIRGYYIRQGGSDRLYASGGAIMLSSSAGHVPPSVKLLTGGSEREIHERLLDCQSDPVSAQIGCPVTLMGQARTCPAPRASGSQHRIPCLFVTSGQWSPGT